VVNSGLGAAWPPWTIWTTERRIALFSRRFFTTDFTDITDGKHFYRWSPCNPWLTPAWLWLGCPGPSRTTERRILLFSRRFFATDFADITDRKYSIRGSRGHSDLVAALQPWAIRGQSNSEDRLMDCGRGGRGNGRDERPASEGSARGHLCKCN
jgi:hypothetical protein